MHLSGQSRVIKFLYSPAPPPPTVWDLKPPLWASCAKNHLCTYDLYSPVHNVLDACISITWGSGGGFSTSRAQPSPTSPRNGYTHLKHYAQGCINHRCINSYYDRVYNADGCIELYIYPRDFFK
jgi:hypothetical protein